MSLETLARIGEFVGGTFVVVSLIYLAHQVRQNTRSLRAENYARVLERMSTLQSRLSADADLNHLVTVGAERPEALTPSQRIRFSWALYELLGAGEFMFHQAQAGALPPQVWDRWQKGVAWWLSHPGIRAWWDAKPVPMSADFEAFANHLVRNQSVDGAAVRRWRGFVAGEGLFADPAAAPGGSPAVGERDAT